MSITILDVKNSLEGMLHGGSLSKVKNLNDLLRRAANTLLSKIDPPETLRISQITNAIHDDIFDYSAPSDLKRDCIVDLRPQVNREEYDNPSQRFCKEFDLRKADNTFALRHNSGEKSLRLSKQVTPNSQTLHNMNSLTTNGTWAVGDDAENLTRDALNYMSGSASLNFDLDGSGTTGYIENSDMTAVDLSDEEDIGQIFVRVYLPAPSAITNVILRWGSSSSAYWSATETSPHDQSSFKTGWNILAFDWNGATETGSPDSSAVDYLRITITYDGTADTDIRVDKIACSRGEIYEIVYYSECLFRTSGGTWQVTTSSDDDILNVDEDGFQIYLLECVKAIAQQSQGADSGFDVSFVNEELKGLGELLKRYRRNHPSQAIKKLAFHRRPGLYSNSRVGYLQ